MLLCINKCGLHLRNLKEELKVPTFCYEVESGFSRIKNSAFYALQVDFICTFFLEILRRSSLKSKDLCSELESSVLGPPDPDPLVRGTDPDTSVIMQK